MLEALHLFIHRVGSVIPNDFTITFSFIHDLIVTTDENNGYYIETNSN